MRRRRLDAAAGAIPIRADVEDLVAPLEHQDLKGAEENQGGGKVR